MSSIIDVNQRLLKILGLEGQRVIALTVHAEVNTAPTITVRRHLMTDQDVRQVEQVFDLQLRQETAAQPECEAMARVNAWIEAEAIKCRSLLSQAFAESWERLALAHSGSGGHAWLTEGFSTPRAWRLSKNAGA